jgi:cell division septal protein FtsQ
MSDHKTKFQSRQLYKKNKLGNLYRFKSQRRQNSGPKIFVKLFFYLLFISAIGALAYLLLWSSFFRISNLIIVDDKGDIVTSEPMQNYIRSEIRNKKSIILPGDNIFFINDRVVELSILKKYSYLKKVLITKEYPDKLRLTIQKRSPNAIWCIKSCLVVDDEGVVYENLKNVDASNLPVFEENQKLLIYDDGKVSKTVFDPNAEIEDVELFKTLVPNDLVLYTKKLIQLLKDHTGIKITKIMVPEKYAREIDLLTDKNYQIMVNIDNYEPSRVIDIISSLSEQPDFPAGNLLYLDLRLKDKAITCQKNKVCGQTDRGEISTANAAQN